jgi:hypothetical protein
MENKIVWILGAGFSRPLGGPLLPDLISGTSSSTLLAAFPELKSNMDRWLKRVGGLFEAQRRKEDLPRSHRLWADAEEFIDFLDTAAGEPEGPAASRLKMVVDYPNEADLVSQLAGAARRLVAGICSAFLIGADLSSEKWEPHAHWFQWLSPDDTVVTFNYDLVLERLAERQPKKIHVVLPREKVGEGPTRVYKLHGSVDWKRIEGSPPRFEKGQPASFVLNATPAELAVATPGPTKKQRAGDLEDLWCAAEKAIETARAVVFVGYRFPPTDANARQRILGALTRNTNPFLALHTVLGPSLHDDDTVRMKELLRTTATHRKIATFDDVNYVSPPMKYFIRQHPLWSQDFLGYVQSNFLLQANRHYPPTP